MKGMHWKVRSTWARARGNRLPDPTLLARRPWYAAGLGLVAVGLVLRVPLAGIAGFLVCVLIFLPEVWYRWGLRGVVLEHVMPSRVAFGETAELTVMAENRSPLPLPWIQVDDEFSELLPVDGALVRPAAAPERVILRHTTALWAYQRMRRRYALHAVVRGAFPLGPVTARITDPFGILEREERFDRHSFLLVHPLIAPIERFGLPAKSPFGDRRAPRRLLEDPLRVVGTRNYVQGDEPRRVHWKATAHSGTLQSKMYEPATRHSLAILLDIRTFAAGVFGYDPDLVELAVSVAASVATWSADQGFNFGLYANGILAALDVDAAGAHDLRGALAHEERVRAAIGEQGMRLRVRLPLAAGQGHLLRVLDSLAQLQPFYGASVAPLLLGEQQRLPFGATIVYIGNLVALDASLLISLRQLQRRGHPLSVLLTKPAVSAVLDAEVEMMLARLPHRVIGGRELWHELAGEASGRGARAPTAGGDPAAPPSLHRTGRVLESPKRDKDDSARQTGRRRTLVVE